MTDAQPVDKRLVRRHFGRHAEEYDRYAVVQRRVVQKLVSYLPETPPSPLALEIGTGTGSLARALGRKWSELPMVLSDLAHGMTCHARDQVPRAVAVDADAASLPFLTGRFSAVFSTSVYQWVDDLSGAFGEVSRVLSPGGLFGFALFGERSLSELRASHRHAMQRFGRGRLSHAQEYPSVTEVCRALEASDFNIRLLNEEEELDFHPDVPALLRSLKKIGAGNASANRPHGLASRRVMTEMIDYYTRQFGCDEGIVATYHVIYGLAVCPEKPDAMG